MRFDFVTIFPRMFDPLLAEGVIARGVKQQLLDVRVHDLRDYTSDKHRSTDDEAYGGGPGMVMLAEPVLRCAESIGGGHVILTSPQGRRFDQGVAKELALRATLLERPDLLETAELDDEARAILERLRATET